MTIIHKVFKVVFGLSLLMAGEGWARTVHYDLTATKENVNLSGKKTVGWAIAVNGGIPAPTLTFTEGDEAEITVTNKIPDQEVSIHWHGILLPPEMDGVAYVNTPPIHSGDTYTFRFKVRQHGTYWYHSHTGIQEQKGVYGAIVILPKVKTIDYDRDLVLVLSDWSDENPDQIIKNLRKDGDYYTYKKGTMRSWAGAIEAGQLGTLLDNEWMRMGGMDLSDVGYDAFLINGRQDSQLLIPKVGEKIRIRIINAGASSYFNIALGNSPMRVIASDGMDIQPVLAKNILMGMAETYDLLYEVHDNRNYELRATAQDGTGYASGWIGVSTAEKVPAPTLPHPDLYAPMSMNHGAHGGMDHSAHEGMDHSAHEGMDHSAHEGMDHSAHEGMDHSAQDPTSMAVETLTVDHIKSPKPTAFPVEGKTYDLKLVLGGDMGRYVWHINGKSIFEERSLTIHEGDIVRMTFVNDTMMHHPMHLHGHFFRVLTQAGDKSPLKHTVDVPPHGMRVIEFRANEPGEWMLHCHNLYHMKTGMARVVKYSSYTPKPEIAQVQAQDPHRHDHIFSRGMFELSSNHYQASLAMLQTWNTLEAHIENRSYQNSDHLEGALLYRRWVGLYLNLVAGATYYQDRAENQGRAVIGVGYLLPLLIKTNLLLDQKGEVELGIEKKFQWTKTLFSDVNALMRQKEKTEFEISLMYAETWSWAAGLMLTEDRLGVGVQYNY